MESKRIISRGIRLDEHDGIRTIKGSAVVYNSPSFELSERGETFTEIVRPGAFGNLAEDIWALMNHDQNKFLGRTSSNTLRLFDNDVSLDFELDLPHTVSGDEAYEHVKLKDIVGMSFTANVIEEVWSEDRTLCELIKLELKEISPVFDPAYGATNVTIRSLQRFQPAPQLVKPRYGSLEYARLIIALDEKD